MARCSPSTSSPPATAYAVVVSIVISGVVSLSVVISAILGAASARNNEHNIDSQPASCNSLGVAVINAAEKDDGREERA